MSSPFGKMFFNNVPKISLNDRFQMLRQNSQRRSQNQMNAKIKNNAIQLKQGSARNRRLALQMANRPTVMAALTTNANANTVNVKQRLGVQRTQLNAKFGSSAFNARNRTPKRFFNRNNNGLSINRNRVMNNGLGINRNRVMNNGLGINRNRVMNRNKINKFANRPNNAQNIGVIVGVRQPLRKGIRKNQFGRAQSMRLAANSVKVGAKQRKRVNKVQQMQTQSNKFTTRKFRINRNFNARNNSLAQRKRGNVKQLPNKQQLDNELDAYMARTKSHLDAEIDEYMSQAS